MTLEWLLIVAAVAAVAAVAVVQVEKVVGETADHATSARARKTAAIVAADQIMRDAARDASQQPLEAKIWKDWKSYYTGRCTLLEFSFGDAGIKVSAYFGESGFDDADPVVGDVVVSGTANEAFTTVQGDGTVVVGVMYLNSIDPGQAAAHCLIEDA